jgi:GWxTD domain-containing protein
MLVAFACARAAAVDDRAARAAALERRALERLEHRGPDYRRLAIEDLDQAARLAPDNPTYQLELARACQRAGFLTRAREHLERAHRLSTWEPEALFGLGQTWRSDWLKFLDPSSLDRAIENFSSAARVRPDHGESWLMLVPLLVERNDLRAAAAAAERAQAAAPKRADAQLAVAYTSYRLGRLSLADSLFAAAIPQLARPVRERFLDIAPVASAEDTFQLRRMARPQQEEFLRRFWRDLDPDLSSPENEAQLEYWSRVAHAYFLYYEPRRGNWDERAEVYARFGPPASATYNPLGAPTSFTFSGFGHFTEMAPAPVNAQVWEYPELGMRVYLQDLSLNGYWTLPIARDRDPDPIPSTQALSARDGLEASHGTRGVFHRLPPGVEPLPVRGTIARFESGGRPMLLAGVEADADPGEGASAEWVVLDSTKREVARERRALSPSTCRAGERESGQFLAGLPPGPYVVGLTVRDAGGRRGVYRGEVELERARSGLALSDVVIVCGAPDPAVPSPSGAVTIEPRPSARLSGAEALTAYFEIYRLTPDRDGRSRFQYEYTVRSAEKDPRIWIQRVLSPRPATPSISASREEQQPGVMRRQFLTVPIESLPLGKYRLEISVRDLESGEEARRVAAFVKVPEDAVRQ